MDWHELFFRRSWSPEDEPICWLSCSDHEVHVWVNFLNYWMDCHEICIVQDHQRALMLFICWLLSPPLSPLWCSASPQASCWPFNCRLDTSLQTIMNLLCRTLTLTIRLWALIPEVDLTVTYSVCCSKPWEIAAVCWELSMSISVWYRVLGRWGCDASKSWDL